MPSLKWMVPEGRPRVFGIYKRVTSIGQAGANDVAIDSESLEARLRGSVIDFIISVNPARHLGTPATPPDC